MFRILLASGLLVVSAAVVSAQEQPSAAPAQAQAFPTPSVFPIAWQFDFIHASPKRVIVEVPGQANAEAFWYITYTVTNNTDRERMFLPVFEMLTDAGAVIRSDNAIPDAVFQAIKLREDSRFLQTSIQIGGQLLLGDDQAKDGVAIWREPSPTMGQFSIFVTGLSGEFASFKVGDKEFTLQKTLQLNYQTIGASNDPADNHIKAMDEHWVMR